jgi:hypothetical protein
MTPIVFLGIDLSKNVFALHRRHGSVFGCAPLGTSVRWLRPHRAADGPEVRRPVPHERAAWQERRGRCRCQGWVKARTATINRLRGLMSEFGVVLPLKAQTVRRQATEHADKLPGWMKTACLDLLALAAAAKKKDRLSRWAVALSERRGYWEAVVAIAAKNARMAWAMLAKGEAFKPVT